MVTMQEDKLDCFARVITPENIEFEYALAGPFQRLPPFALDLALRAIVFVVLLFVIGMLSSLLTTGGVFIMIAAVLSLFVLSWFYGIFFETRFNGRTPGKMLFKLRVISVDGRPIHATQAALRNLLRLGDMCLMLPLQILGSENPPAFIIPTFSIGLLVMVLTARFQRLGDLAAGTMVVSEYTSRSPWNLLPDDLRAFGLAERIPANFQIAPSLARSIGFYMENRKRLNQLRRNEIAKHLARPLIEQFGLLPDTSYDLLLTALYVRIFLSEQQQAEGLVRLRESETRREHPPVLNSHIR
jgi:uncharacterized RDD family membrane protein YckC